MAEIDSITDLFSKFEHIVDRADDLSAVKVQETNESAYDSIGRLFYRCKEKVSKLLENEDTAFLAASVIERYWNTFLPAIVVPAGELLAGDTTALDEIRQFQDVLKDNPAKEEWSKLANDIVDMAKKNGYEITHPRFNDLSAISDIVYDALTIQNEYAAKTVYRFKTGCRSAHKPILLNEIGIFSSESEAFRFFERLDNDAFVAFAGIAKTYGQTNDDFTDWRSGDNERHKHTLNNLKLTEEEYQTTLDPTSRSLKVVIRDGDNLYMFGLPQRGSGYEDVWKRTNYYGQRPSYGPSQIFWKDAPPASSDTKALVPAGKKHWKLSEIIDEEQQIWLPIFYNKVVERFFKDSQPETVEAYMPEEVLITVNENNSLVPVNKPSCVHDTFRLPEPDEVFTAERREQRSKSMGWNGVNGDMFDNAVALCKEFGITSASLKEIPVKHSWFDTKESAHTKMLNNCELAYCELIGQAYEQATDNGAVDEAFRWYRDRLDPIRLETVIQNALLGKCPYAEVRIDKRPVLNEDGTPKTQKKNSWSTEEIPVFEHTDIDEGKQISDRYGNNHELRIWYPTTLIGKHPPVVLHIHPENPEQIADICGCTVDELPLALKYHNIAHLYTSSRKYYYCGRRDRTVETNIRVIYGKREYKKALEEAQKAIGSTHDGASQNGQKHP